MYQGFQGTGRSLLFLPFVRQIVDLGFEFCFVFVRQAFVSVNDIKQPLSCGNQTVEGCICLPLGSLLRSYRNPHALIYDLIGDKIRLAAGIWGPCPVSEPVFDCPRELLCHRVLPVYDEHPLHGSTESPRSSSKDHSYPHVR